MRLLFSLAGGSGHFDPQLPLARAAAAAGHTLACAGEPAMRTVFSASTSPVPPT